MRTWLLTCVVFIWLVAAVDGGANLLVQAAALLFPGQGIDLAIAQAAQAADNAFGGVRAGLAAAGVIVIKLAVFLGFLFNYKRQVTEANEIGKGGSKKEAEEAAEAEEAGEVAEAEAEERVERLPSWLKNPRKKDYHPFPPTYPVYKNPRQRKQEEYQPIHPTYPSYKNQQKRAILNPRQGMQKRAILNPFSLIKEGIENRLAAAVTSLDSHGCLNKLMCHFNKKHPSDLVQEESIMMRLFSSGLSESEQGRSCSELFPYCSAGEEDLSEIFTDSWSYLRGTLNK